MTRLIDLMQNWVGQYNYNLDTPDYPWILSAILVIVVVFGVVSILRSLIRKV